MFLGGLGSIARDIPARLARERGAIASNASIAGSIGCPDDRVDTASTCDVVVVVVGAAALGLAPRDIRVSSVCPGGVETERNDRFAKDEAVQKQMAAMHPMGRVDKAEEIASAVVWLCSKEASFVTGAQLPIDGGFTAQ
jgi:NAD(P)-dependent dehydrogenase (short-subunit alcohol dehydrogenase family)